MHLCFLPTGELSGYLTMKSPAPVALFVYNRPVHTEKTVQALLRNKYANESEVYVFSDGPKYKGDEKAVEQVRQYIRDISGFKKLVLIEREKNYGLAKNIVEGVSEIINKHKRVIVIEDDLVTSPFFLKFMNEALDFYSEKKDVWHISGWNYPIDHQNLNHKDTFLWRVMNCWGWATWEDRWRHYKKDPDYFISTFSKKDIKKFDLDGAASFWRQILDNKTGRIDTWAIFWYATIFANRGLCLNPVKSYVENIGLDGSGVHCKEGDLFTNRQTLNFEQNVRFPDKIVENEYVVELVKKFLRSEKRSVAKKLLNKISRYTGFFR